MITLHVHVIKQLVHAFSCALSSYGALGKFGERFFRALQTSRVLHNSIVHAKAWTNCYRGQPKAGTGHKMLFVPFVFSKSRFHGPAFRCDKSLEVHIVTLLEAIEGIPDKDYNFWGNENFHNLYERLLHERKFKSGYLEKTYLLATTALESEPFIENQSEHISKLSLHQYINLL